MTRMDEDGGIRWLGQRRLDSLGPRFVLETKEVEETSKTPSKFFRAVLRSQENSFWALRRKESVEACISRGLILEEKPTDEIKLPRHDAGKYSLVLEADSLGAQPRTSEIPFERRVRMAKLWLEINSLLLDDRLCLIDAHLGNFAFDRSFTPVWIDFGSVQPLKHGWEAFEEFRSHHLRPLGIAARSPEAIDLILTSAISQKMKSALFFGRAGKVVNRYLLRHFAISGDLFFKALELLGLKRIQEKLLVGFRQATLRSFRRRIDRLPSPAPTTGRWSKYRAGAESQLPPSDPRGTRIADLISSLKPESVIDIGANDGWVVLQNLAANTHFCAVEPDHGAISRFTNCLERVQLPAGTEVRALVGGFGPRDHKHDLVIALALTHHLSLSQEWSFEAIASVLRTLTNHYVLVEFMPWGLVPGGASQPQRNLPSWYTEEDFVLALEKYFYRVQRVDYEKSPRSARRVMYLCEKQLTNS